MKTLTVNQQYLKIEKPPTKLIAIKSPKGSGKTQWLKDNCTDSTLFISHRVALVEDIARRNGTANYQEGSTAYKNPRLVITLDSLPALFHNDIHQGAIIVIDEASQVLRHLIGGTLRGKRKQVIDTLHRKLYYAKQVILLDADLDTLTLNYFAHLAGIDPTSITWIENTYNVRDKKFIEYPTAESLQVQLLADLKAGLKCYVASDSKGKVKDIETFLISKGLAQVLTIHGDNSNQNKQTAFISNVNEEQLKYQSVICSPSVSTGVDINQPHFDKVYLFANGANSTSKDLLQAVARVRTIKEVNFWINSKVCYEETNWEKILKAKEIAAFGQGFLNSEIENRKANGDDYWAFEYDPTLDKAVVTKTEFMNMYCQLNANINKDLNDLHSSFIEAAKKEGTVTTYKLSDTHTKLSKAVKEESKSLRKQRKENEKQAILNAADITPEEYAVMILTASSLSQDEANSVKKYKLINVLLNGLKEHLEWAVDHEKTAFRTIYLQDLITKSDKELEIADAKWYKEKLGWEPDIKNRTKTKKLIVEFLERIGYYESLETGTPLSVVDVRVSDICLTGSAFSYWANKNKFDIKELLGVTVTKQVIEKPFQVIQSILNVLGLETNSKKVRVKNEDILTYNPINWSYQSYQREDRISKVQIRYYYADKESYQRIASIIKAKQAKEAELEKVVLPF